MLPNLQGQVCKKEEFGQSQNRAQTAELNGRVVKPISHSDSDTAIKGAVIGAIMGVVLMLLSAIFWPVGSACGIGALSLVGQLCLGLGFIELVVSIITCVKAATSD